MGDYISVIGMPVHHRVHRFVTFDQHEPQAYLADPQGHLVIHQLNYLRHANLFEINNYLKDVNA